MYLQVDIRQWHTKYNSRKNTRITNIPYLQQNDTEYLASTPYIDVKNVYVFFDVMFLTLKFFERFLL